MIAISWNSSTRTIVNRRENSVVQIKLRRTRANRIRFPYDSKVEKISLALDGYWVLWPFTKNPNWMIIFIANHFMSSLLIEEQDHRYYLLHYPYMLLESRRNLMTYNRHLFLRYYTYMYMSPCCPTESDDILHLPAKRKLSEEMNEVTEYHMRTTFRNIRT